MAEALDTVVKELANLGWRGFQAVNAKVPETPSPSGVGAGAAPEITSAHEAPPGLAAPDGLPLPALCHRDTRLDLAGRA
jgi:hypothetical protein